MNARRLLIGCSLAAVFPTPIRAQHPVSLTTEAHDTLPGVMYGAGPRGVVLIAHGGHSTNTAWAEQAASLAARGFHVLSFETRAAVLLRAGQETDCLYDPTCMAKDVSVAVRYLRLAGAHTVAVIGGSAGGGAAAQASVEAPGTIDRLVLLAPMAITHPDRMTGKKLFITSRNDRNASGLRLPGIREQYRRASEPKRLVVLEGAAHGQRMFSAPERESLFREMLHFLREQ